MVTNSLLYILHHSRIFFKTFFCFLHSIEIVQGVIITDNSIESIGFLTTEVRTANGAIPLENALVYVYSTGNENKENERKT